MYPAVAVLQALAERNDTADVLWVGGAGGMEADLVKRAGIPFETISAGQVHGVSIASLPRSLVRLSRGYFESRRILGRYQPDVLFFTGGFVAVPMALAGRSLPSVLYVPDIEPGLALKFLAPFARRIAVTAEDSRSYFPRHKGVVVTGYPTRPELKHWEPGTARRSLGLAPDGPVLLVFGGSKGARSINQALAPVLPELLRLCQVVHISGSANWDDVQAARQSLPAELSSRYLAFPYLHDEMGAALAAADVVVARAGASTLGEFPLFGLPSVLVPYPHAWRYQKVNADYLQQRGAAIMVADEDLPVRLLPVVRELLAGPARLMEMRQAAAKLARPQAAAAIVEQFYDLVPGGAGG